MYTHHKLFILFLVIFCAILITHAYAVKVNDIQLSIEEKIQFDREFRQLQKPSLKTIQNENGDIYDCVDFYKQPAFDHPLLKNHSFHPEMTPSLGAKYRVSYDEEVEKIQLKGAGCPTGSVPIRRYSKSEFYEIKKMTQEYAKSNTQGPTPGTHYCILRTNSDPQRTKYVGAGVDLCLYNLSSIQPSQYSSTEITFRNNDDMIKVGVTANPTLNKDTDLHIFQYFSAGELHSFNTLCPGFVNMKEYPIGVPVRSASTRGGALYAMPVDVHQDPQNECWWLVIGSKYTVGFWPNKLFSSMSSTATYIAIGGEAYGSPYDPLPPMGNGYYPVDNKAMDAFASRYLVMDENFRSINPEQTETYCDNSHYAVLDKGIMGNDGRIIFYGGTTLSN